MISEARANNQPICFVRDDQIIYSENFAEQAIIDVKQIPMTMSGAAVHNINNALGAVALAKTLGIDNQPIRQALSEFASDAVDNPGRGNMFEHKGAKVILDFAHNAHSMDAMVQTLQNISATRKIILLCHAGDRSDAAITTMTESIMAMKPDLVWICELPDYMRGREVGELPRVINAAVMANAKPAITANPEAAIHYADSPLQGAIEIESQLQQGDLVFMMALSHRDQIAQLLS